MSVSTLSTSPEDLHLRKPLRRLLVGTALVLAILVASVAGLQAVPSAAAHASPVAGSAPASSVTDAQSVAAVDSGVAKSHWGFNAQIWSHTVADPKGFYRYYFYKKCNPQRGVRYMTMKTGWVYTTYECWAILA